jgi:nucleoside 2-deoxyribosyltransferase
MDALRSDAHEISHDWTRDAEDTIALGIPESDRSDLACRAIAEADIAGVMDADVLVFLCPTETSKMAWTELGVALALCKRVVVAHDIEERRRQSIVLRLAEVSVDDAGIVAAIASFR